MSTPTPPSAAVVATADPVRRPRTVERVITGIPTQDGAGVKLTRVLTQPLQRRLDPFLMLDAFGSDDPKDYGAGFPDHPHRGFETVTYMIAGRLRHRDSHGNEGLLQNGGVQWMTAGRGLVHSEMPEQEHGVMEGFQLWLNLPARDKLCEPGYRDIPSEQIPEARTAAGGTVRVIAGHSQGMSGAMQREATQPYIVDLHLAAGEQLAQALPPTHHAFFYVYRGQIRVGGTLVDSKHMAILAQDSQADGVVLEAAGDAPAQALLIAGQPLNEPIAQYGPFVMNSNEEIFQAVEDFRAGRLA